MQEDVWGIPGGNLCQMPGLDPGSGVQAEDAAYTGCDRQAGTQQPHQKRSAATNG